MNPVQIKQHPILFNIHNQNPNIHKAITFGAKP